MATRFLALTLASMAVGTATAFTWFEGLPDGHVALQMRMMGGGMMPHMMHDMVRGRLPSGIEPGGLPDPESAGAALLTRYCMQCHNLPSPAIHTADEWPSVTQRMFERMAMMAERGHRRGRMGRGMMAVHAPTAAEQGDIVTYLQQHALRPAAEAPGELPDTPEGTLFRQTCSRCHALPDSASHTPDEWPSVVERMRKNMENMARSGISDQERDVIVRYLQEHASR